MAKALPTDRLSAAVLDNALLSSHPYKLYDGDGLLCLVRPNGSKLWRFKYRYGGKEQSYSVGVYPAVSIQEARDIRQWCREQLASGIDPNTSKRDIKAQEKTAQEIAQQRRRELELSQFKTIAEEWFTLETKKKSPTTIVTLRQRLRDYIYPAVTSDGKTLLQDIQIADVKTMDYLPMLRKIETEGKYDTAHRVKDIIGAILRYSAATRNLGVDTTANLKGMLVPISTENHQAITDPDKLGPMLRDLWEYNGKPVTKAALRLGAYLYKRASELRYAEWSEFKWDLAEWHIPGPKMKMKDDHIVPMPSQAIEIIQGLKELTGSYRYVFPNDHDCTVPMSNGAIRRAMINMGYQQDHTEHGWRATAKTLLEERLGFDPRFVEMSLAHAVKDPNGTAYPRGTFLVQRKQMAQVWADYLDSLRLPR